MVKYNDDVPYNDPVYTDSSPPSPSTGSNLPRILTVVVAAALLVAILVRVL